jgi:hypothetical protein
LTESADISQRSRAHFCPVGARFEEFRVLQKFLQALDVLVVFGTDVLKG